MNPLHYICLALLVGCAPLPGPLSQDCEIDGALFHGDRPMSCENLAANAVLAREIFPGLEMAGVEVNVRDEDCVDGGPVTACAIGAYSHVQAGYASAAVPTIVLNARGHALLHELLHHLSEIQTGDSNPGHLGWDTNGFNDADQRYRNESLEVME